MVLERPDMDREAVGLEDDLVTHFQASAREGAGDDSSHTLDGECPVDGEARGGEVLWNGRFGEGFADGRLQLREAGTGMGGDRDDGAVLQGAALKGIAHEFDRELGILCEVDLGDGDDCVAHSQIG